MFPPPPLRLLTWCFFCVSLCLLCQQHKDLSHNSSTSSLGTLEKKKFLLSKTYVLNNISLKVFLKKQTNDNKKFLIWLLFLLFLNEKDQATKEKTLQNMSSMSSAQIVSASSLHNNKTGLSGLGLPAPVSYPPPVHTPICFDLFFFFFLICHPIFILFNDSLLFCLCKCYHSFGSLVFNPDPLKSKFLLFLLSTD